MSDPKTTSARTSAWSQAGALALRFGPVLLIVLLGVVVVASGALEQIDVPHLRARHEALEIHVAAHPLQAAAVYVLVFAVGVMLSLPVALLMTMLGGLLFGWLEGGLLAAAASTLGGVATFLICRTAVGDLIARLAGPRMKRFQKGARSDAFSLILTLRLVPMTPFWLINVGAACVRIPLRPFLLATAIGVIPSSLIYASLGSGLQAVFDGAAAPLQLVRQPQVLIPLVGLALLGTLPLIVRRLQRRRAIIAQTPCLK